MVTKLQSMAKQGGKKDTKWTPPRGIRFIELANCPLSPYAVQWRSEGKRKTKTFRTKELRERYATTLARDVKQYGVSAYRLDEAEAKSWRSFRAQVGDADLDDVARHWLRSGVLSKSTTTVAAAIADYIGAKTAEGLSRNSLNHFKRDLEYFGKSFVGSVAAVARAAVEKWLGGLPVKPITKKTYLKRVRALFSWLRERHDVAVNPCDGIKSPKVIDEEVSTYSLQQGRDLFDKNAKQSREVLGRLALEAFAGLRTSSAGKVTAADINFGDKGIGLPAANIKTRRREYIDGLPDNLWKWLEWAKPETWKLNPRNYQSAKGLARVRADLPELHNALRHSFCSYHIAAHKDQSRTSVILCHTSPRTLWRHYKGKATTTDGIAWFQIVPPAA